LPIILGGDFNIMMTEADVYNPKLFEGSPLYIKPVQDKIIALQYLGLHDAFRLLHSKKEGFTFWDYVGNAFVTNSGLRIDYLFLSAYFAEKLKMCEPDKALRSKDKPSDHTVLIAEFED
jgi:exodeoxyribonuclease-3